MKTHADKRKEEDVQREGQTLQRKETRTTNQAYRRIARLSR